MEKNELSELLKDTYCINRLPSVIKIKNLESRTANDYQCLYCNGYNLDCERYLSKKDFGLMN